MIAQYFRPQSLEDALKLLSQPRTRPLGGGTILSHRTDSSFSVVDLQDLGLDKIRKNGINLEIGATVTLQTLLESAYASIDIQHAIDLETPLNLRNLGTVAGTLVECDGRSPFGVAFLALDAKLTFAPGNEQVTFGNYLPLRLEIGDRYSGKLITRIDLPLNIRFALETVARTPADKPIVCAALAQWPSGRTRLALGGWGPAPTLALDGNELGGVQESARNACAEASDEWASAEYRMDIAGILAKRCQESAQ
jgi:putative selenate reductase FAD-binding subunit